MVVGEGVGRMGLRALWLGLLVCGVEGMGRWGKMCLLDTKIEVILVSNGFGLSVLVF